MEFRARPLERGVGFAIVASLLILAAGVIVSTQGQNLFRGSRDYIFYMENGLGVRKGTPVTVNGLPCGSVETVDPEVRDVSEEREGVVVRQEVDQVKVTIRVFEPYYEYLRDGSRVKVILPFIMGSTSIDIQPGPVGAKLIDSGGLLEKELVKGLGGKVETFIDSGNRVLLDVEEISDKLKGAVANIEGITHRINYGKNTLGELLNDDKKMYDQIIVLLKDADDAARTFNELAADLKKVTRDLPEIVGNLRESSESLRLASGNAVEITTDVRKIPHDIDRAIGEIRDSLSRLDAFTRDLVPLGQSLSDFAAADMPRIAKLISDTADAAILLEVASRDLPGVMQQTKDTLRKTEEITLALKGTWPIKGNLPPASYQPKSILIAGRISERAAGGDNGK